MAEPAAEPPIPNVGVVANKLRRPSDAEAICEFCDRHQLNLLSRLPWLDAALDADKAGTPCSASPPMTLVTGIGELADLVLWAPSLPAPVAP